MHKRIAFRFQGEKKGKLCLPYKEKKYFSCASFSFVGCFCDQLSHL